MLYVLTVNMQKGGVGKTTTTVCLAQASAEKGKRVLVLDLDPQGNTTFALGGNATKPGTFALITGQRPAAELVQHCGGIDVIPASKELPTLTTTKGSALRLRKAMQPIAANYDFIVIDTPTLEGEILYNALCSSNGLLIPTEASIYAVKDIYQLKRTAERMQKANEHLQIVGYVLTRIDTRSIIARTMQEHLQKVGIECVGRIRTSAAIQEAAATQKSLYKYEPKCNAAIDYMSLYEHIEQLHY